MKKLLFATLVIIGIVIVSLAISGCNKKQAAKAPAVVEIKAAPAAKPTVWAPMSARLRIRHPSLAGRRYTPCLDLRDPALHLLLFIAARHGVGHEPA